MARWLIALPLALLFWLSYVHAKRRFRREAAFGPVLRGLSRLSGASRDVAALTAAAVALAALALALMRPQVFVESRQPEYERQDLVLVLDRSASMGAEDVPPSRSRRAIEEIKAFLAHKPEGIDRVGLVGFAGTSIILSRLTRDLDSLFFYLDWIQGDREPHFGTDIAGALASARELVRKDGRPTRKILLMLSDGDDEGRQLARQLAALREEGTPVHCIGIGSDRDAPIPVAREGGGTQFLQDERGELLKARFEESTLRAIASSTGGRYFRSTTGRELAGAMREVARQERRVVGWKSSAEYRDAHRPALMAAAAAAFLLLRAL